MSVIVLGGGTNGLAAAIRLARAGRAVTLLEARDQVGGVAAPVSFHPGFRSAGLFDSAAVDSAGIALGLVAKALPEPVALSPDGGSSPASDTRRLDAWIDRHRPLLTRLMAETPVRLDPAAPLAPLLALGLAVRRGGVPAMRELLRVPLLSAEDWLSELGLDETTRGLIEAPALVGGLVGPRQPTTAAQVLAHRLRGNHGIGGPAAVLSLEAAARAAAVDIRLNSPVARIRTTEGAVRGVTLADGTALDCDVLIATCDPRATLLTLLDPWDARTSLRRTATAIRARGAVAQLLLACSRPPIGPNGALISAWIGSEPRAIERAFDRRKYAGLDLASPGPLHLTVPSADDASLAPPGHATVSIRWTAAPTEGWTPEGKERAADALVAAVDGVLPGFSSTILARALVTPADLAATFGCSHPFHAEHALDQMWVGRPAFGLGHHATPIAGLFLGSAGSHPGGGVVGTAGWLAAGAVR